MSIGGSVTAADLGRAGGVAVVLDEPGGGIWRADAVGGGEIAGGFQDGAEVDDDVIEAAITGISQFWEIWIFVAAVVFDGEDGASITFEAEELITQSGVRSIEGEQGLAFGAVSLTL